MLEQAGGCEKMALEMMSSDSMAELRAEVTQWWKAIHANSDHHPPFRILAHGKEIGEGFRKMFRSIFKVVDNWMIDDSTINVPP